MSDKFTVVKPLAVTDAMVVSTNVQDEAIPAWQAGSCTLGQQRIYQQAIWECKQTGSSDQPPAPGHPLWLRVRSVNSRAALDRKKFTATRRAGHISYVFAPGAAIGAFAALNLNGASQIRVRLVDPASGTVYDKTQIPGALPVAPDWHAFWLLPWEAGDDSQGLFMDLPAYPFAQLHVDITGTAELAVGAMLFGPRHEWGAGIRFGLQLSGRDYSLKETDRYGETELVEGFYADLIDCNPVIYRHEITHMHRFLKGLRATPALYVIVQDQAATNIYAKYTDFRIVYENAKFAELSIQLESII